MAVGRSLYNISIQIFMDKGALHCFIGFRICHSRLLLYLRNNL